MEVALKSIVCTCFLYHFMAASVWSPTSSTSAEQGLCPLTASGELPLPQCLLFSFYLSTEKMSGHASFTSIHFISRKKIGGMYSEVGLLYHMAILFLIFEKRPHCSPQ